MLTDFPIFNSLKIKPNVFSSQVAVISLPTHFYANAFHTL